MRTMYCHLLHSENIWTKPETNRDLSFSVGRGCFKIMPSGMHRLQLSPMSQRFIGDWRGHSLQDKLGVPEGCKWCPGSRFKHLGSNSCTDTKLLGWPWAGWLSLSLADLTRLLWGGENAGRTQIHHSELLGLGGGGINKAIWLPNKKRAHVSSLLACAFSDLK